MRVLSALVWFLFMVLAVIVGMVGFNIILAWWARRNPEAALKNMGLDPATFQS